jgi:hypothetical protein
VNFLRPEFERLAAPVSNDWDAEARIHALTEEQFEALERVDIQRVQMNALMMDSMERNARGVCS